MHRHRTELQRNLARRTAAAVGAPAAITVTAPPVTLNIPPITVTAPPVTVNVPPAILTKDIERLIAENVIHLEHSVNKLGPDGVLALARLGITSTVALKEAIEVDEKRLIRDLHAVGYRRADAGLMKDWHGDIKP
jgi:hypothetical protein